MVTLPQPDTRVQVMPKPDKQKSETTAQIQATVGSKSHIRTYSSGTYCS